MQGIFAAAILGSPFAFLALPPGELAAKRTERARTLTNTQHTVIQCSFQRTIRSLRLLLTPAGLSLSVIAATMPPCPPFVAHATSPPTGGVFPSRGAFGKESLLFVDCQGLSYKERWHPEGMTERLYKSNPLCYTTLIQSRICGKL